jgi:GT2 family glycosyltransferase
VIPIALFAYKRVEHLALTLDALKKNSVPLIYAFSDGPKSKDDINEVKSVRDLLRKIDWCKVIYFEEDHNLGLGKSIRKGISRVFEDFEKVIVIEDDIVMRPGAFKYTVDALNYYENHEEVMSVSMWADPFISQNCQKNGFFSERFVCWGWGTYKKYWKTYTGTPLDL